MIKEEDYLKAKQIVQEYEKQLNISDVMFSEERTEVKCCIGGYVIEKDQFGTTGRIFKCVKCNT